MTKRVASIQPGDYAGLAKGYSRYRAGYSRELVKAILALLPCHVSQSTLADVGAGTGIFTRLLASFEPAMLHAVEPNAEMLHVGLHHTKPFPVKWIKGSAQRTGLRDLSCDFVSMASSFHWTDTHLALNEFVRILKPGGVFAAVWNPRALERNSLLKDIEDRLYSEFGLGQRVSSGTSGITIKLTDILRVHTGFHKTIYLEAEEVTRMSKERYMGIWRSVNDVRAQLGEARFKQFLLFCERSLEGVLELDVTYLTRAWVGIVNV